LVDEGGRLLAAASAFFKLAHTKSNREIVFALQRRDDQRLTLRRKELMR
jgi:hypothetical protein